MKKETIKKILNSTEGEDLCIFIKKTIGSLDRCADIPDSWTDKQKAIEITSRKRAAEKLAEILKPFVEYEELPEKPEKEIY
jgi:hypothetical protein